VSDNEGQAVREGDVREVQSDKAQGQGDGYLRESEAQAETGLN
jgi:predicted RNA-binding protein with TRAM domain